jgi:hypothetical protein
MILKTSSLFCPVQDSIIAFYQSDVKGLLCGTNWLFK